MGQTPPIGLILASSATSVLVAVIGAVGTVAAVLIVAVYRQRKIGEPERESVIAEASERVVNMMKGAMEVAERERAALIVKCARLEERVRGLEVDKRDCHTRIDALERELAECRGTS